MVLRKPAEGVIFANGRIEEEFNKLPLDNWLKKALLKAIGDLKENIFVGRSIPKRLIPKEYVKKYGLDNLWWYQLPNAWRLVYSVMTPSNKEILGMIVEYFNHKNYAKRFGYKT